MDGRKWAGTGVVVLMVLLMAGAGLCRADEDGKPFRKEQITGKLAKAWNALYDGDLTESIKLTGPLTKLASSRKHRWAALEAGHVRARALWRRNAGKSRRQALQLWKTLSGASTRNAVKQRQAIVRALRLRASLDTLRPPSNQPRLKEAIGLLQELAENDALNTATPEAKILLARLQAEAGEFGKAKEMLDSVIKTMKDEERVRRMEIPLEVARVFTRAARKTKNDLDYQRGDGRKTYERARKLQTEAHKTTGKERQKKYAQAITLYRQVTQKFPESTYAPRSQLQIGHCLAGLGRPDRAIAHWDQFVSPNKSHSKGSPSGTAGATGRTNERASGTSGAWRGQAYVALIDLLLERRLDLDGAWKYAEMARGAIDKALQDEQSAPSWKKVAREVWLRIGLVSLCRGQNSVAAKAFQETKERTKGRFKKECLTRLIRLAKADQPLIPGDAGGRTQGSVSDTSGTPALALSIGMVHTLGGSYDAARRFFERVAGRDATEDRRGQNRMPAATAAQVAFGEFGKANLLEIHNRPEEALEHYRKSLTIHPPKNSAAGTPPKKSSTRRTKKGASGTTQVSPSGTSGTSGRRTQVSAPGTHDETLYRVGMLIEELAEGKVDKTEKAEKTEKRDGGPRQLQRERQRRMKRRHRLAEAKAEALPVWHRLIETYPRHYQRKSLWDRAEVASYHLATLRHGLARTVVGGAPQKTWRSVAAGLKNFCEEYPESWCTGDAAVRWMEVALERLFDRELAGEAAEAAVGWAKRTRDGKIPKDQSGTLPAWYRRVHPPIFRELKPVIYRCYARAGLVAYLGDNKKRAVKMYKQARRFEDSRREKHGLDTGMDRMAKVAAGAMEEPTPKELPEHLQNAEQKTCLQLADLSLLTFRPARAEKLYRRLLAGERPFPAPNNAVQSYLVYRIGQALKFQGKREEAYRYLKQLYTQEYSGHKWAAGGVSRLGTWTYNATQDAEAAMPHWKHVFTEYPQHPAAEKSLYFYATMALDGENYQQAERAFELYLKRYPDTECARAVRSTWLPLAKNKEQYGE